MKTLKDFLSKHSASLLLLVILVLYGYNLYTDKPINPRSKNGVDTLIVDDSIYVLKFNIDTAYVNNDKYEEAIERN